MCVSKMTFLFHLIVLLGGDCITGLSIRANGRECLAGDLGRVDDGGGGHLKLVKNTLLL